jgi:hypothetical protein
VRVPVPAELGFLPYRPWEVAAWQGRVLGREQVGFVFDLPDSRPPRTAQNGKPARQPTRMLALFSLPTGSAPLGLRRERHALQQFVRGLGQGQSPKAVQLRVLQYGVTRKLLATAVDDASGWDVLHVSGHGGAGVLVLEHEDGAPDVLDPGALAELLKPMRSPTMRISHSASWNTGARCPQTALISARDTKLGGCDGGRIRWCGSGSMALTLSKVPRTSAPRSRAWSMIVRSVLSTVVWVLAARPCGSSGSMSRSASRSHTGRTRSTPSTVAGVRAPRAMASRRAGRPPMVLRRRRR